MKVRSAAVLVAVSVVFSGCATQEQVAQGLQRDKQEVDAAVHALQEMKRKPAVIRMEAPKLADKEMPLQPQEQLPAVFARKFSYVSIPQPLSVILGEVGRRVGYPVRIQNLVGEAQQPAAQQPSLGVVVQQASQAAAPNPTDPTLSVDWSGDLKGLLDHLAMRVGMFWKLQEGEIYFYRTETRTFTVHLPQGLRKLKASIGLGSVSSGGQNGSSGGDSQGAVSIDTDYSIDAYDAIRQGIYSILEQAAPGSSSNSSTSGAVGLPGSPAPFMGPGVLPAAPGAASPAPLAFVSVNPALGTVTVTASPMQLQRVAEYISAINDRFARNILIDVKVYNVMVRQGANIGAALALAYQNAAGRYSVGVTTNPLLQPGNGTPGTLVVDYTSPGSRWLGSQITLQALKSLGDVTLRTSGQVIAVNGQPTPLQVANEITYLASASTTATGTTGPGAVTTALIPGVKTVGMTANFLPMIMEDNRILLQYQINLSNLVSIDQVSSGGQTIQTPTVSTQALHQQAYVRNGQSIVLFGFEQDQNRADRAMGIGGLSRNDEANRSMSVIVMEVYSDK